MCAETSQPMIRSIAEVEHRPWFTACSKYLVNWSEPHKTNMVISLARENNMAEDLGFTCVPDAKRGTGYCSFEQGPVRVWECVLSGRGVYWARAKVVDEHFTGQRYFCTLEDALHDRNCYAVAEKYYGVRLVESAPKLVGK